jgi:hypothetical protein
LGLFSHRLSNRFCCSTIIVKMEIVYKNGKDRNLPHWRVSISIENKAIYIKTDNFDFGFRDGEWWDKVSTFNTFHGTSHKENYVSIITKDKTKLEEYKQVVIDKMYEVLEHNIKVQKSIIKREENSLKHLELANQTLFKDKIREEKINGLIDERN